jgi:hypothetical protein
MGETFVTQPSAKDISNLRVTDLNAMWTPGYAVQLLLDGEYAAIELRTDVYVG